MKKFFVNLLAIIALATSTFATPPMDVLVTLRSGTVVSLTLNEEISTDEVYVGNSIDFTVRSNVTVNGQVLIAAGTIAEGQVKKVKRACNGKCPEITIVVDNVQAVDGQRIFLRSRPHILKAKCCNKCGHDENEPATLQIGTNLSSNVLNDVDIDA
jgi:hypothetical protein